MTGASSPGTTPREAARPPIDSTVSGRPASADAAPWIAVLLLASVGGLATWLLSRPAPTVAGAARITSAPVLLATFDVLWFVALAWPRPCGARARTLAGALLLAVGLPFHAALAAAAGASGGHAAACAAIAASAAFAGGMAGARRAYVPLLALALFAVPLAAYALTDLAPLTDANGAPGSDALSWGRASPLLAAVLLALRASDATLIDGIPAVVALLAIATAALAMRRPPRAAVALLLLVGGLATTASAAPPRVEAVLGGHVREGRPLVVRAPGARRVRVIGGPWSGPVGARGDEFVLLRVQPAGATLALEVDRSVGAPGSDSAERVDVAVRPLSLAGTWTAALDGREAVDGLVLVRPVDLPTIAEAWLVFDAVVGVPDGLAPAELLALRAHRDAADALVPDPALLVPSPLPFRAATEAAAAAPGLTARAARPLLVLAVLIGLLALLMRLRPGDGRTAAWAAAASIVAAGWLFGAGDVLPGAIRANAIVLSGPESELVLLRLAAVRDGEVTVEAPQGAGVLVPLRWGSDDEPPDGQSVGTRATLRIARGRSVLLAVRVPTPSASGAFEAGADLAPGHALADWLADGARGRGVRVTTADPAEAPLALRLTGADVARVDRFALLRSD